MTVNTIDIRECGVCNESKLRSVLKFPNFPLSGIFVKPSVHKEYEGVDLDLGICNHCKHLQLRQQLDPATIYTYDDYSFRGSKSFTAKRKNEALKTFLLKHCPEGKFKCIMDIGCNDLYMLGLLKDKADYLIGVDPIWAGKEDSSKDKKISLVGKTVEDLTEEDLKYKPDLIICSHTLEHLSNPRDVLEHLVWLADEEAYFLIDVPNFEVLQERYRFDQIFHHHFHYFSTYSLYRLIELVGCDLIASAQNYEHWGSLLSLFKKGRPHKKERSIMDAETDILEKERIEDDYKIFRQNSLQMGKVINSICGEVFGFGAAQLLPVFCYHWETDLSNLTCIYDDDPLKDSLTYLNLDIPIKTLTDLKSLEQASVIITAIDNFKFILDRLGSCNLKRIINPLLVI